MDEVLRITADDPECLFVEFADVVRDEPATIQFASPCTHPSARLAWDYDDGLVVECDVCGDSIPLDEFNEKFEIVRRRELGPAGSNIPY